MINFRRFFQKINYIFSYSHEFQHQNSLEIQLFMLTFIYYCTENIKYKFQKNLTVRNEHRTYQKLKICEIFNFEKQEF